MTVTQFVDQQIKRTDNVNVNDPDNAERRNRVVEYLVEVFTDVWFRRHWWFRFTRQAGFSVPTTGTAVLPANFRQMGPYGGLYLQTTGNRLDAISQQELEEIRERPGFTTSTPEIYSIFGQDAATSAPLIQTPKSPVAVLYDLSYELQVPALDEGANVNNLVIVPADYHQSVLIPGVRAAMLFSRGDARTDKQMALYEAGLARMCGQERQMQESTQRLPSFFGGRRPYL